MVLENQRKNIDYILLPLAKKFIKIKPDYLTWVSLLFAFLAGLTFYLSNPDNELEKHFLLFASFFVFLNGLFDALDGKIAKITKTTSKRGDFLDHAIDRYSDVLIVGGLTLSSWCDIKLGLLALVGILLTSYMGTQAQAIGYKRDYSGLLGRADRLVLLMIIPIIQYLLLMLKVGLLWGLSLLEFMLIYFAIMGNITAIQRFYKTLSWLKRKKNG